MKNSWRRSKIQTCQSRIRSSKVRLRKNQSRDCQSSEWTPWLSMYGLGMMISKHFLLTNVSSLTRSIICLHRKITRHWVRYSSNSQMKWKAPCSPRQREINTTMRKKSTPVARLQRLACKSLITSSLQSNFTMNWMMRSVTLFGGHMEKKMELNGTGKASHLIKK